MIFPPRLAVAMLIALFACSPAAALNPKVRLQDLNHASWSEKDGVPADVQSMAQTPDGWLWLGTVDGLYRFDGIHFERFHLPAHPHIVRNRIFELHAVDNGDLLISYVLGGLSVLHADGTLVDVIDPDVDHINAIGSMTMERDGTIWAAALDGLHRRAHGRWQTMSTGPDWATSLPRSVLLDQYGRLWASNGKALYLYDRTADKVARVGGDELHGSLLQSPDGRLWVGEADSVRLVPDAARAQPLPRARLQPGRGALERPVRPRRQSMGLALPLRHLPRGQRGRAHRRADRAFARGRRPPRPALAIERLDDQCGAGRPRG